MIPDASKVQRGNLKELCKKLSPTGSPALLQAGNEGVSWEPASSWEPGSSWDQRIELGLKDRARTREQARNEPGMVKQGHVPMR